MTCFVISSAGENSAGQNQLEVFEIFTSSTLFNVEKVVFLVLPQLCLLIKNVHLTYKIILRYLSSYPNLSIPLCSRCIRMALVHDLAESIVGDITPDDGVSKEEKYRRELVRRFF